jgi:hypothetical protein
VEIKETDLYSRGKVVAYGIGRVIHQEIKLPINPALGKAGQDEYRWVTASAAKKLLPK